MTTRRTFIGTTLLAATAGALAAKNPSEVRPRGNLPRVVSTWDFGIGANAAAWKTLAAQGSALDAVEAGARWSEADLCNSTVGRCGNPDRDGVLTLDASIMDGDGRCGAVAALEDIAHPISVARKVMEATPHVLLVGAGAQQFALAQGFKKTPLLTDTARKAWQEWRKESKYAPTVNAERAGATKPGDKTNHDTLGILAIDANGRLAGACTTSGMAWKLHGRVGDSPIVGAGLYVDNEVAAPRSIASCASARRPARACRCAFSR